MEDRVPLKQGHDCWTASTEWELVCAALLAAGGFPVGRTHKRLSQLLEPS